MTANTKPVRMPSVEQRFQSMPIAKVGIVTEAKNPHPSAPRMATILPPHNPMPIAMSGTMTCRIWPMRICLS